MICGWIDSACVRPITKNKIKSGLTHRNSLPINETILQVKGLDTENLYINHGQTNRAPKQRRRTYRAHGRINRESSRALSLCAIHPFIHHSSISPPSTPPPPNNRCPLSSCTKHYTTAYMSSPAHVEIILGEKPVPVKKEAAPLKLSRKRQAQRKVRIGGGN